jgi:hypothetical protein
MRSRPKLAASTRLLPGGTELASGAAEGFRMMGAKCLARPRWPIVHNHWDSQLRPALKLEGNRSMTAFRVERPATAFSLDRDRKSRSARRQDRDHLSFIRSLPCTICGSRRQVEAAHVRYADPTYGKASTGLGTKPDDRWTVPLCATHHRIGADSQHANNERDWWSDTGIDPLAIALKLHAASGDDEAGEAILLAARSSRPTDPS